MRNCWYDSVTSQLLYYFYKIASRNSSFNFYTNMEVKVETKIMQNLNDTKINLIFILYYLAHNFLVQRNLLCIYHIVRICVRKIQVYLVMFRILNYSFNPLKYPGLSLKKVTVRIIYSKTTLIAPSFSTILNLSMGKMFILKDILL